MRMILFLLLVCHMQTSAQSHYLDSLKTELRKSGEDTLTVQLLNEIGTEYLNNYPDSAKDFIEKAFRLATKIEYKKGLAISLNYLGRYYSRVGHYSKAADYFFKGLNVKGFSSENKVKTMTYYNLGQLYSTLSSLSQSTELHSRRVYYFKKCIDSFNQLTPAERKGEIINWEASAYIELAHTYTNILIDSTKFDSAVYYYSKADELAIQSKSREISFSALSGLSSVYLFRRQYADAVKIGHQLLELSKKGNLNRYYAAFAMTRLSDGYKHLSFDSAYYYSIQSLKEIELAGDEYAFFIPGIYSQLGQLFFYYKRYAKAIEYFQREIEVKKKMGLGDVELSHTLMADSYKQLGNYKKAYELQSHYMHIKDSLLREDTSAKLARMQGDFDAAKQEDQIQLLEKETQLQELLLARRQSQQILIGVIALFLLILIGVLMARNRIIRKSKQDQEKLFTEMDQLKSRFFANISHEFRTPLTLMLGPIEKRLSTTDNGEEKAEFSTMHRNGMRLLTLVNQLLDLSRFEAGTMKLQASSRDIVDFVSATMSEFQSIADSKNIQFKLSNSPASLRLYFDEDKLKKILSNLLSNAFKFTPDSGSISVEIMEGQTIKKFRDGFVEIRITDSGIGMESEHLTRIFERFYQVDNSTTRAYEGSGIGLSLTKELVELHQGTITVRSQLHQGTTFCVQLPLGKQHLNAEEIVTLSSEEQLIPAVEYVEGLSSNGHQVGNDLILIIEDNEDLRNHLKKELSVRYQVSLARDGEEGVQRAIEEVPSLIISDLMMPKKDGLAVCSQLRADERTSHIPLILLTAKVEIESRLDGLRSGADDYMAKPFSMDELSIRIQNLIEGRKLLQKKFAKQSITFMPRELNVDSMEEAFLKKVSSTVEQYLGDTSFSVEIFAKEIGMSQVQLYRKLTALTDYSPNEFIRHMRLQRAANLIQQRAGNIAEVAYQCGFNNLSYFSKVFKEKFGVSPSEYMKA